MLWSIFLYVILPILALLAAYTYYMSRKHGCLQKMGLPGPRPWPIFGTLFAETQENMLAYHVQAYRKYRDHKAYCGYFGRHPIIYPRDLDIIKDIFVKHFDHFTNRNTLSIGDPIDQALTNMKDEDWKRLRTIISPAFSSGKLKRMVSLVQAHGQHLVDYLREKQETGVEVELKNCMSRFTMDSIASTGFGVSINSFTDSENQFTKEGNKMIQGINSAGLFGMFLDFLWPLIKRVTNLVPQDSMEFFKAFIDQALDQRKQEGESKRHDFLQLVLEAEKENEEEGSVGLTHNELQGQALLFIFGGFETTAFVLGISTFLLSMHPECLKKAQEEIDEILQGEKPDYDNVQKLTYLDMCLSEALRMYPPGFITDRVCNEEIELDGVKFPKDVLVLIPICGIHYDPEIYPEPEKFIPERFTPEAKAARHPYAYLPFGQGPRNCIGMRLAQLTMKIGLASVLQVMTPVRCEKSVFPIKLAKVSLDPVGGLWVKMERRK